ncbi:tetratricopeptide repeat protein [Rhodopirellula sallentina]|uniref:Putative secreted protein n=1 Tax=Rhodopirellula sallentina SM41 TaxID=1263870 RepID=M5U1D7_9BACT|nr:hypothetical protein [Rhodopirellula sallentina]EMI55245.1 putative secreted protein [Rhodopirellula sallentina SM41]
MLPSQLRFTASFAVLLTLALANSGFAQTDRVYPNDGDAVIGKVKDITKNEVVITAGGKDQNISSSDIRRILFQGDPAELTRARELIMDGQYDQAFDELKQLDISKLPRQFIKADAQFYLALSQGQMALSGQGDLNKSTADAIEFAKNNSNSWHFYPAMKLLGDLAKALGNYEKAAQFYGYLRSAPSRNLQIESVYLGGMVKLAQDDLSGASSDLGKVAGIKPNSPEESRLQTLAKAALAVVAAKQGNGKEAIEMVNKLIEKLNPTDTQTAATIYNAQGESFAALGDDEGALLAYLHTQLMYSMHAAEHSEALKKLVELWNKVGKPDRAAQARGELQQRYPGLAG